MPAKPRIRLTGRRSSAGSKRNAYCPARRLPLLAEQNEIWAERRYLDMDEFREWRATRQPTHAGGNIVAPSEKRDAITGSNLQQNLDLTVPGYFLGAW